MNPIWSHLHFSHKFCSLFEGSDEKSSFLNALGFFLAELATKELEAAEGCFRAGQRISLFSPRERDQYNYSKCTIIVRLMEFATVVLVKCQQDFWKVKDYLMHIFGFVDIYGHLVSVLVSNKTKLSVLPGKYMYITSKSLTIPPCNHKLHVFLGRIKCQKSVKCIPLSI